MTDLGSLLASAQKVQEAVGLIKATKGSSLELARESLFSALNDIVVEILRNHLNKVEVKLDPQRPQRWDDRLAVLQVIYGGISLKIPVPKLRELDGETAKKVKIKMSKFQERVRLSNGWLGARLAGTRNLYWFTQYEEERTKDPTLPEWNELPIRELTSSSTEELESLVLAGDVWERTKAAAILVERSNFSQERRKALSMAFDQRMLENPTLKSEETGFPNVQMYLANRGPFER